MNFWQKIKQTLANIDRINRESFVEVQKQELAQLEVIFALLTHGQLIGLPQAPAHISLELLPLMEKELDLLLKSIDTTSSPFGYLFSIFDID